MISVQHVVKYYLFININTHIEQKKTLLLIIITIHACRIRGKEITKMKRALHITQHTTYLNKLMSCKLISVLKKMCFNHRSFLREITISVSHTYIISLFTFLKKLIICYFLENITSSFLYLL